MSEDRPLLGKVVLTTRAKKQSSELAKALEELGAKVVEFPTIKVEPLDSYEELDGAINELATSDQRPATSGYDWVIFTSANGVIYFLERLKVLGRTVDILKSAKLAAIGPATAMKLEEIDLDIDFMPEEYRAEGLVEGLEEKGVENKKILIPRAKIAREILPESLRDLGATVDVVSTYQTLLDDSFVDEVKKMLEGREVDIITFTSSSTVKNFYELLRDINLTKVLDRVSIACIGPITAATAEELGLKVDVVASEYTISGLVDAIGKAA